MLALMLCAPSVIPFATTFNADLYDIIARIGTTRPLHACIHADAEFFSFSCSVDVLWQVLYDDNLITTTEACVNNMIWKSFSARMKINKICATANTSDVLCHLSDSP